MSKRASKRKRSTVEDVDYEVKETRRGTQVLKEISVPSTSSSRSVSPSKASRSSSPSKLQNSSGDDSLFTDSIEDGPLHSHEELHTFVDCNIQKKRLPGKVRYLLSVMSAEFSPHTKKTPNDILYDWLPRRKDFLNDILAREGRPDNDQCHNCPKSNPTPSPSFRCVHCIGTPSFCENCCYAVHQREPFHNIQKWDEDAGFYHNCDAKSFIMKIFLGHNGEECPQHDQETAHSFGARDEVTEDSAFQMHGRLGYSTDMVLVDVLGVRTCRMVWCKCSDSKSMSSQLLQAGLYPASVLRPETAFTFRVLDHFYLDVQECHTSAYSFYQKLSRLTNPIDPRSVPVCVQIWVLFKFS